MEVPQQIVSEAVSSVAPNYSLIELSPNNGSQQLSIKVGGGQNSTFDLPSKVYNLSRSYFSCKMQIPAAGAGKYSYTYADVITLIRDIHLTTFTNYPIVEHREVSLFSKVVRRFCTKLDHFLTLPLVKKDGQPSQLFSRSNTLTDATSGASLPASGNEVVGFHYIGPRYWVNGGDNTAFDINIRIPLKSFYHTLFEKDIDIYFGQQLRLKIDYQPGTKIAWSGSSATIPTTGAAAIASDINLSAIKLYLSIETNPFIIERYNQLFQNGYSIIYENPVYSSQDIAGSSKTFETRHDDAGISLVRIYCIRTPTTSDKNVAYDLDTTGDVNIKEFHTTLDNRRLQEFNINKSELHDWMLLEQRLNGSVYYDPETYQANWAWVDDWGLQVPFWDRSKEYLDTIQGLPRVDENGQPVNYKHGWVCTTVDDTDRLVKYAIYQRELKISINGIVVI